MKQNFFLKEFFKDLSKEYFLGDNERLHNKSYKIVRLNKNNFILQTFSEMMDVCLFCFSYIIFVNY